MQEPPSGSAAVIEPHPSTAPLQEEREGGAAGRTQRRSRPATVRRRILWTLMAAGGVVIAVAALRGVLPHPADVVSALRNATAGWVALAAVAEALSMTMFAWQQRRLLGAFGVPMSLPRAVALTYAGSALSISMPAGAVVSAGFTYRQYRARGAGHHVAAGVIVLSGVLSAAGLAILYGGWIGAVTVAGPALTHPAATIEVVAAVGVGIWAWVHHRYHRRRRLRAHTGAANAPAQRRALISLAARWPWADRMVHSVADAADVAGTVRRSDWAAALAFAVGNWVGDLACLILVGHAFGLTMTIVQVGGIYLAVQIVRQIPVTPGGIGLIEASLLVALVAAGAPSGAAAAVVLVYRVLSCWLIVPTGLIAWVVLQSTGRRPAHDDLLLKERDAGSLPTPRG
jgi:uncharacterized membrane protein YbhN (UPF0104 family)